MIAKVGAEGVHSARCWTSGIGFALKVEDGAQRAQFPAVIRCSRSLDALPEPLPPRLAEYLSRPVRNTRGEVVGERRIRRTARKRRVRCERRGNLMTRARLGAAPARDVEIRRTR